MTDARLGICVATAHATLCVPVVSIWRCGQSLALASGLIAPLSIIEEQEHPSCRPTVKTATSYQNQEVELAPSLDLRSEADIFEALGLAYVPPWMRYFGPDYE